MQENVAAVLSPQGATKRSPSQDQPPTLPEEGKSHLSLLPLNSPEVTRGPGSLPGYLISFSVAAFIIAGLFLISVVVITATYKLPAWLAYDSTPQSNTTVHEVIRTEKPSDVSVRPLRTPRASHTNAPTEGEETAEGAAFSTTANRNDTIL